MQRKFSFSEGEYYHVYNRGVDKRDIFMEEADRIRFQRMLYLANSSVPFVYRDIKEKMLRDINRGEKIVAIGAYCLMPNHFHILVKEIKEGGVSSFMEKLTTGYSMYFNKKHSRSGALFQGKFKAQHANNDEYLKYLYAYIHLNPVKAIDKGWGIRKLEDVGRSEKFLQKYQYSSFQDYVGKKRDESLILSSAEFPEYFSRDMSFEKHVTDWLNPPELD